MGIILCDAMSHQSSNELSEYSYPTKHLVGTAAPSQVWPSFHNDVTNGLRGKGKRYVELIQILSLYFYSDHVCKKECLKYTN